MSLIKDIKTILTSKGIENPIYLAFMPEVSESLVFALFQTGGRGRDAGSGVEEPTFQLFAKSADYEEMTTVISRMEDIFHEAGEIVLGDTRYLAFFQDANPIYLGQDATGRYQMSVNFRCLIRSIN